MIEIVHGQKVISFAQLYLKMPFRNAIGIGFEENGYLIGGVIFDDFKNDAYGKLQSAEASVIVLDKRCISRHNIVEIFKLSFAEIKIRRLQIRCGRKEKQKRRLVERLGFTYEGILREAWPFGGDCACYSMLANECRWLHGKLSQPSSGTQPTTNSPSPNWQQSTNGVISSRA